MGAGLQDRTRKLEGYSYMMVADIPNKERHFEGFEQYTTRLLMSRNCLVGDTWLIPWKVK